MVAFRGADKFFLLLLDRPDYREALPVFFVALTQFLREDYPPALSTG
jgi:hypothetical protein